MEQFGHSFFALLLHVLLFALLFHVLIILAKLAATKKPRLPPGPWQLPVIGSLHHLLLRGAGAGGLPAHRAIRDLSQRHGPLMLLRICERVAVVVSSAESAREIFKGRHGAAFEQRPSSPGIDELSRHGVGVIFAPYGDHWRLLRRIVMAELLGARRVEAFRRVREDEAARLVASLLPQALPGGGEPVVVDVGERLAEFITGVSVRAIFGDMVPHRRAAFLAVVKRAAHLSSLFDLRDLFPSSRLVRVMVPRGKAERHRQEMFRVMDDILGHHEERRRAAAGDGDGDGEQDMVDVLLRVQKEAGMRGELAQGVIRAVLNDLFGAAVDTATTTLQWAMAELMANPRVLKKVQLQIRQLMAGQAIVHEEALRNLGYLKAIIKETLRLHPPAALVPRVCLEDCKIQGYDLPQGTIILTNVWAISRDPKYWENPDMFIPERFEVDCALDYKGIDFEFTPFGTSRRICPGINFANANMEIALASLLYHFDWKLPIGVKPEKLDMTEVFGVTVRRKAELLLHPIPTFHI
ncbi:unnamed protein product [Urochloa decumbens]|uniref:Cytochrome P450 n=1 Tax=Urochloa decumbens TaxID=240449 RepID=A0ABC8XZD5_9POAL